MGVLAGLAGVLWVSKFASAQGDTALGLRAQRHRRLRPRRRQHLGRLGQGVGPHPRHHPPRNAQQRAAPHQCLALLAAVHPGHRHPRRRPHQRGGQEEQPAARAPEARHIGATSDVRTIHQHRQAVEPQAVSSSSGSGSSSSSSSPSTSINGSLSHYYLNFRGTHRLDELLPRHGLPRAADDLRDHPGQHRHLGRLHRRPLGRRSWPSRSTRVCRCPWPCSSASSWPRPAASSTASSCVRFKELSAVIVTLATMIIYRGIAYVILAGPGLGPLPEVVLLPRLGLGRARTLHPHRLRGLRRRLRPSPAQDELRAQDLRAWATTSRPRAIPASRPTR